MKLKYSINCNSSFSKESNKHKSIYTHLDIKLKKLTNKQSIDINFGVLLNILKQSENRVTKMNILAE